MNEDEPTQGDLDPTRPIEVLPDGRLRFYLYDQAGNMVPMAAPDDVFWRNFIVWTRKFDRYGPTLTKEF